MVKCGRFRGRTIVFVVGTCCVLFLVSKGYSNLVDDEEIHNKYEHNSFSDNADSYRRAMREQTNGESKNIPNEIPHNEHPIFRPPAVPELNRREEVNEMRELGKRNDLQTHEINENLGRDNLNPPMPNLRHSFGKNQITTNDGVQKSYPNLLKGKFIPPRKIVHFDLKGAALRVQYFEPVFKLIKELGGTGVLLEWEDMFPYEGQLAITKHANAYTKMEISTILEAARGHGLEVIPLVQTFGHLEWILKHPQFVKYRQVEKYAQVICLADSEAVDLVKDAVDQVLNLHIKHGISNFHMGADEAFQVGMCQKDQDLMRKELENSREALMLRHIVSIAKHIKKRDRNIHVQMWHDMLNNVDSNMMKQYNMGTNVEPVVWAYAENLQSYLYPDMWQRFGETFPTIWGASSFKGADGPSRFYSNVPHYLQNHISWIQQMTDYFKFFNRFEGLILTGWQRFDHFALLCETFPVGIPSMAVNLVTINSGEYTKSVIQKASKILQCSSNLDIETPGIAAFCKFPGAGVYQQVQQLRMTLQNIDTELYSDFQVQGWLSRYNMVHNYSSAWYLDQIMDKLNMHFNDLNGIQQNLRVEMAPVFFPDTIDEFIFEYVEPDLDKMQKMIDSIKRINLMKTFPARPFKILGSTGQNKQKNGVSNKFKKIVSQN